MENFWVLDIWESLVDIFTVFWHFIEKNTKLIGLKNTNQSSINKQIKKIYIYIISRTPRANIISVLSEIYIPKTYAKADYY